MALPPDPARRFAASVRRRPNQARCVEDDIRPLRIKLQHRAALNIDVMLARLCFETLCMLVRDAHGELFNQLGDGLDRLKFAW